MRTRTSLRDRPQDHPTRSPRRRNAHRLLRCTFCRDERRLRCGAPRPARARHTCGAATAGDGHEGAQMSYAEILYDVTDGVAEVTLNRPEKLNAWTLRMGAEVEHALRSADADPAVR